jgi:uncharacterized membrane protein YuzA (DUF378 family)
MKGKEEPLGFFMCLPLALVGALVGGVAGLLAPFVVYALLGGNSNISGLLFAIVGIPSGAVLGGFVGFRIARRL